MMKHPGFLGFPDKLPGGAEPRIVLFGAPYGSYYLGTDSSGYAQAATEIRAASAEDADLVDNWDFDLDGPLFAGHAACCVDIGDLPTRIQDNARNRALIEAKTREILAAAATPVMIGGDDSVPIPFFAGFSECGPIWILQIDAHIDWRDEIHGERFGYSSPMRRASEMAHVAGIVQVGIRSVGSARSSELEAAKRYGSRIVTAREVHARGIEAAIRHIPEGARIVITLDCDGLDPSVMPGVVARTPGGLSYMLVIDLIEAASRRGRIAGFDLVELHTPSDIGGISALTAARILVNVIGRIVRQV
ncbi:agmatinase [Mesorhizobium qingshengii]|uniref:Agmatinase n=1 Tax=Mesorhizobium qingshengii TaxID=1165689 RepID=A0A1G5ZPD9_9HYPH|nr:agmatinase [Mesorhizobium qingshengii]SDA96173.1 agmatinase [Mesorhizobium qingshengii]